MYTVEKMRRKIRNVSYEIFYESKGNSIAKNDCPHSDKRDLKKTPLYWEARHR